MNPMEQNQLIKIMKEKNSQLEKLVECNIKFSRFFIMFLE